MRPHRRDPLPGTGTAKPSLADRLGSLLDGIDARTSLYAKHLPSGRELALRADELHNALSTIKLAILVLVFRDAEAGRLNLDERVPLARPHRRRGSGVLQTFDAGLQPTLRDLATQMIVTSDNTATDLLIERLGLVRVNALLAELGYSETRLQRTIGAGFRTLWQLADPGVASLPDQELFARGYPDDAGAPARARAFAHDPSRWLARTTAREMGRLLEQMYTGELAPRAASDQMLAILARQVYATRLPARLAPQVRVAHKTGDWPPMAGHDVGILFGPGGPIIVALYASDNRGPFWELEAAHAQVAVWLLEAWDDL